MLKWKWHFSSYFLLLFWMKRTFCFEYYSTIACGLTSIHGPLSHWKKSVWPFKICIWVPLVYIFQNVLHQWRKPVEHFWRQKLNKRVQTIGILVCTIQTQIWSGFYVMLQGCVHASIWICYPRFPLDCGKGAGELWNPDLRSACQSLNNFKLHPKQFW